MNATLLKQLNATLKAFAIVLILGTTTLACQENKEQHEEDISVTETSATEATQVANKRPAPESFYIPEELSRKRVWICENETADVFHVKHDCPILIQCKGKGTFRNIILPKAIEDYGRYNCQECSKGLDYIFDESVKMETGLGQQ